MRLGQRLLLPFLVLFRVCFLFFSFGGFFNFPRTPTLGAPLLALSKNYRGNCRTQGEQIEIANEIGVNTKGFFC